jgi:hypothetical protein
MADLVDQMKGLQRGGFGDLRVFEAHGFASPNNATPRNVRVAAARRPRVRGTLQLDHIRSEGLDLLNDGIADT